MTPLFCLWNFILLALTQIEKSFVPSSRTIVSLTRIQRASRRLRLQWGEENQCDIFLSLCLRWTSQNISEPWKEWNVKCECESQIDYWDINFQYQRKSIIAAMLVGFIIIIQYFIANNIFYRLPQILQQHFIDTQCQPCLLISHDFVFIMRMRKN